MDNSKPFDVRKTELQAKIIQLCKDYKIEVMPVLERTLQSDRVQMVYIDLNDSEQVKKFGLVPEPESSDLLVN